MTDPIEEHIHDAVRSGDVEKVREILERNPSCINDLDENFDSPLHVIYCHVDCNDGIHRADNKLSIIRILITYKIDVNIKDKYHMTPLHYAVKKQQIDVIKILLKNKANPNIRNSLNQSALNIAVFEGCYNKISNEIIKLLLDFDADPNLSDLNCKTALDVALQYCRLDYVQILLDYGARAKNVYKTLKKILQLEDLHCKLSSKNFSFLVDFLLSHTDQIIERGQFLMSTMNYYYNISKKDYDYIYEDSRIRAFLESLRRQGVNVDDSIIGDSDLHSAVRQGNEILVKSLLDKEEKSVNAKNSYGETPLHFMFKMINRDSFYDIGRRLLNAGADYGVPNLIDETPFQLAVRSNEYTLVKLMLSKIAKNDYTTLECEITNLPTLNIHFTENDEALHELLVAIYIDCEPVIDRLLDDFYNIDDANKCSRQDITVALAKAIKLNNCNIVKKLLEAGFRSDGRFPGDLPDLTHLEEEQIGLICLLREFNDQTSLDQLFRNILSHYFPNLYSDSLINLLFFYYAINEYLQGSDPDLMRLQVYLKWNGYLMKKYAQCKNDLFEMKKFKLSDRSVFDVMTMELDSLIELLNNKKFYHICTEKISDIRNSSDYTYYDIALRFRLELAIEKNKSINLALHNYYVYSKNLSNQTNNISLPYIDGWNYLLNLNMWDLKKLS